MDYDILFFLAKKGALFRDVKTSTVKMAESVGSSQQTISRKLRELEDMGYLKRTVSNTGMRISLTDKTEKMLNKLKNELNEVFSMTEPLKGKVKSGLDEGRFYIQQKSYMDQFQKILGFKPYPGTLNVVIDLPELKHFLSSQSPVRVKGFATKKRSFGGITCYKVNIRDIPAAIIFPDRTTHEQNEIEIIASPYLRGKFKLKDDDTVEIDERHEKD